MGEVWKLSRAPLHSPEYRVRVKRSQSRSRTVSRPPSTWGAGEFVFGSQRIWLKNTILKSRSDISQLVNVEPMTEEAPEYRKAKARQVNLGNKS